MKRPIHGSGLFELRRLVARVPTPANYFKGLSAPMGTLPGNILCFARQAVSDLLRPAAGNQPTQHHRCILLVALKGEGTLCIDADQFAIGEGQAQFICPFQFHSYIGVHPRNICWLFVTFETLSMSDVESLRASPSRTLGSVELTLLHELVRCWMTGDPQNLPSLHLGLLLARLRAINPQRSRREPSGHRSSMSADLLCRVNNHILARLDQPLGLKELAVAVGQSTAHLRARFREATGCSLGRHIRQLRMQRACGLLHTTGMSIGEVGEQCGFESVYSFSRTFKAEHGVSPRDYRNGVYSLKKG